LSCVSNWTFCLLMTIQTCAQHRNHFPSAGGMGMRRW
jgi:hypothetical protein